MSFEVAPEAREILAQARLARVATVAPTGRPGVAPLWFHFDGERIVLFTGENQTVRNLRADPRATVLVDLGERFHELRAVRIRGRARVFPYDEAPDHVRRAIAGLERKYADDLASELYRELQGDGPPATIYVEILPESASWWDFGRGVG